MQDEYDQWSEPQELSTQGEAEPSDPPLDFDLACVRCGYNLRGTMPTGNCPECGEYVATTLRPDLLHMAHPTWLGKMRKGMNWLVAAIIVNLSIIPIALVIGAIETASATPTSSAALSIPVVIVLGIYSLIMAITYCVAIWLITEPEHDAFSSSTLCAVTRWTILPAMALSVISTFFDVSTQTAALVVGGAIDLVSSILLIIGFVACLLYLRRLANRIPEPGLAKQTMIVLWGNVAWVAAMLLLATGIMIFAFSMANSNSSSAATGVLGVMGLMMCPLLIAMLVFGIWWIVLMFRYRTRFAQAHEIAKSQQHQTRTESY